jgi:hypothetical protein
MRDGECVTYQPTLRSFEADGNMQEATPTFAQVARGSQIVTANEDGRTVVDSSRVWIRKRQRLINSGHEKRLNDLYERGAKELGCTRLRRPAGAAAQR